jgi:hypothetical protein
MQPILSTATVMCILQQVGGGEGGFISTFRREHGMGGDGAGVGVKCSKHGQVCRVMGRFLVAREVFRCLESIQ